MKSACDDMNHLCGAPHRLLTAIITVPRTGWHPYLQRL